MIQENHTSNGVLPEQEQCCPVCQTKNESVTIHCKTCSWYFPLAGSPQYALELSRAKQQFQMVNTFNQVLEGLTVQAKMLEKIGFRLDGFENEVTELKKEKPVEKAFTQKKYTYPVLTPIQKVADFDTVEKRATWWTSLEAQWKKAFNQAVLQKENEYQPSDEEIKFVLETPVLRLVGPKGMHPSIDFELTNLSGVRHLTDLNLLVLSQNALTDLEGIEYLTNLQRLFVNSNKLTHLKEVWYLPQLLELNCNANQIVDLLPIANLTNLESLYCCYNRLNTLDGILKDHTDKLKEFRCLPNDKVTEEEIDRVKAMGIVCQKG